MGLVCRIKIKCSGCGKDIFKKRVIPIQKDIEKQPVHFETVFELPEGWGTDIKGGVLFCPNCLLIYNKKK